MKKEKAEETLQEPVTEVAEKQPDTEIVTRVVTKKLKTTLVAGSKELTELIEMLTTEQKAINDLDLEIDPLKAQLKAHKESQEKLLQKLVDGEYKDVQVEQTLNYSDNTIREVRLDTGTEIANRPLTEEDKTNDLFDKPKETDPADQAAQAAIDEATGLNVEPKDEDPGDLEPMITCSQCDFVGHETDYHIQDGKRLCPQCGDETIVG